MKIQLKKIFLTFVVLVPIMLFSQELTHTNGEGKYWHEKNQSKAETRVSGGVWLLFMFGVGYGVRNVTKKVNNRKIRGYNKTALLPDSLLKDY